MSQHLDIKTLAGLKRALTVGTRLRVIDHWNPDLRNTSRVITKTQTNGVYFQVPESDKWKNAWMPYPPAKNVSFPAPGRVRYCVIWTRMSLEGSRRS